MSKSVVILVLGLWFVAGEGLAQDPDPEEGKYYTYGQLGVKNTEVVSSKIQLTFQPKAENAYWCPGITIKETQEAVAVTFVRCETFKSCSVDVDAKIGKHLIRTITIDTRGKDTYVKNGAKQYKKIYAAPKQSKKTTAQEVKPAKPATGASVKRPPRRGWIENTLVLPYRVKR